MRFLIILLLPLQLFSQDIEGVWTGFIQTGGNSLPYELVVSETNGKLTGYSLTIFTIDGVENIGVKSLLLKKKNGNIILEDDKLIYNNYNAPARRVKIFSTLSFKVSASVIKLSGNFRAMSFRSQDMGSYSGTISLQKQSTLAGSRLISKLDELNLLDSVWFAAQKSNENEEGRGSTGIVQPSSPNGKQTVAKPVEAPKVAAAELTTRKKEIIRTVPFRSDSLVLSLYDNGIVDGDTVSVVLNDQVIVAKQRLTNKPLRIAVPVTHDHGDSLLLIMYAENLGTIPPNTGVLYIQDADTRYEIRFEGDLKKSSAILLKRVR